MHMRQCSDEHEANFDQEQKNSNIVSIGSFRLSYVKMHL